MRYRGKTKQSVRNESQNAISELPCTQRHTITAQGFTCGAVLRTPPTEHWEAFVKARSGK